MNLLCRQIIFHSVFGDRKLINIRVGYQSLQDLDIDIKQSTQTDEVTGGKKI